MYRQFNVEFTQVKNSSTLDKIIGVAVEGYTGKEPISEVKITEVDRLVLRKKPSGSGKVPAASTVPQTTSPDVSTRLVSMSPLSRSGRHATMPTGAEALDRSGSQPWQDCSPLLGSGAGSGLQALA